ncbi:hypothetical protein KKG83_06015 [Candidatus Micrarchaeota archaeon]|nr:hypothetical protein [Candidatus Micrarchaeota archaeon]MBU2476999.1 hypothetical protein [Candidatus Micrarchaeota archaeon]
MDKGILISLLIIGLITFGCVQPDPPKPPIELCGNGICDEKENSITCPKDCQECDDNDKCTKDSFNYKTQKCENKEITPCCGNGKCETTEDFFSCPKDCKYDLEIAEVKHSIIPSGYDVIEVKDNLEQLKTKEGDYMNSDYYIEIPFEHPDSPHTGTVNSHDFVDLKFIIPEEVFSLIENKKIFFEMDLACGEYGQIFVEVSNKFGEMDTLEKIKCEANWEEKHIKKELELSSNEINIILRKDGGVGKVKVDYATVSIE